MSLIPVRIISVGLTPRRKGKEDDLFRQQRDNADQAAEVAKAVKYAIDHSATPGAPLRRGHAGQQGNVPDAQSRRPRGLEDPLGWHSSSSTESLNLVIRGLVKKRTT